MVREDLPETAPRTGVVLNPAAELSLNPP